MVETIKKKDVITHATLESIMFAHWQCIAKIEGITVSFIPSTYFIFISLDFFSIFHKKIDYFFFKLITLNAFYVVLTPSIDGDFIAYVSVLVSCGVWTRFPSSFVVGMLSKHDTYMVLKKSKMWTYGVQSSKTFMMWCTCSLIMDKKLMTSKSVGGLLWEKTFTNIRLVMRGQITSRLITINLVSDNVCHVLVFKTLL